MPVQNRQSPENGTALHLTSECSSRTELAASSCVRPWRTAREGEEEGSTPRMAPSTFAATPSSGRGHRASKRGLDRRPFALTDHVRRDVPAA